MKFLALLVVILSFMLIQAYADLVTDTCLKTSNPKLCERILRSSPRSPPASVSLLSVSGLGLIMLREVKLETNDLFRKLKILIERGPPNLELIPAYKKCVSLYAFLIHQDLEVAIFALRRLEAGDPKMAEQAINLAIDKFNTCESELKGKPPSPIGAQDIYARELAIIASSIIKVLEGS